MEARLRHGEGKKTYFNDVPVTLGNTQVSQKAALGLRRTTHTVSAQNSQQLSKINLQKGMISMTDRPRNQGFGVACWTAHIKST